MQSRLQQIKPFDRPAVIFGDHRDVPAMHIRFIDGASGKPLTNQGGTIIYGWRWLEYPYPEHAWGAWNDTGDKLSCHPDEDGWFLATQHRVQPRGWYDGKYTRWPWKRRPEFTGVSVVAVTLRGFARIAVKTADLKNFAASDLTIRIYDGWRAEPIWTDRH